MTKEEALVIARAELKFEQEHGKVRAEFASLQEAALTVIQASLAKLLSELQSHQAEQDVARQSWLIAQSFQRYRESMPCKLIDALCSKSNSIRRSLAT